MKTPQDYKDLVVRLDTEFQQQPRHYRLKLILVTMLGYAYIGCLLGVIASCLAITAYFSTQDIQNLLYTSPLLLVAALMLKFLWIRIEPPQGRLITEEEAPKLYEMAEKVRQSSLAHNFHGIILVDEFKAAIYQIPRLGLFGWHRNYLILGLPLLYSLKTNELKAIIAHEFGHLSYKHARFINWIYRSRITWTQILKAFEEQKNNFISRILVTNFLSRYAPYYLAFTFPFARNDEYEADDLASLIVHPKVLANALIKVYSISDYISNAYWQTLIKQAAYEPLPPKNAFSKLLIQVQRIPNSILLEQLNHQLLERSNYEDTHPCLDDRLRKLDQLPKLRLSTREPGHTLIDDDVLDDLMEAYDEDCYAAILDEWKEQHQKILEIREEVNQLEEKEKDHSLDEEQLWIYASNVEILGEKNKAMNLYKKLIEMNPEHGWALLSYGKYRLEENEEEALNYIEKAMAMDEDLKHNAHLILYQFYITNNRIDLANEHLQHIQGMYLKTA